MLEIKSMFLIIIIVFTLCVSRNITNASQTAGSCDENCNQCLDPEDCFISLVSCEWYNNTYCDEGTSELPTTTPVLIETLDVILLSSNGQCDNLNEAITRDNYISLPECIQLCESMQWEQCIMIQYYDKLLSDVDSRCYTFDQICHLSQEVGDRANTSHIYYKNQFTKQYCVDYRDWTDKYTDTCDAYVTHELCSNGQMTEKSTMEQFEEAKDQIYGFTASDACCQCGGGKDVYETTAVSFLNEQTFDDTFAECSFKTDIVNTTHLAEWNNFALYQLIESINNKFYKEYPLDTDLFIYTDLLDVNDDIIHDDVLIMCDFSSFDLNETSEDVYTDFFIFASVEYTQESLYFINSEYFNLDLNVISEHIEVETHEYKYCNTHIANASFDESVVLDMIIPCFEHHTEPSDATTTKPIQEIYTTVSISSTVLNSTIYVVPTEDKETFFEKYVIKYATYAYYAAYPINKDNWMYWVITSSGLCVLLCCCICCCVCRVKKRKKKKKRSEEEFDVELAIGPGVYGDQETDLEIVIESTERFELITDEKDALSEEYNHKDDIELIKEYIARGNEMIIPLEHTETQLQCGILYEQYGFYNEEQIQNIKCRWDDNPQKGPKLCFGDNIVDKKRSKNAKRQSFGNQSEILGHYDRSYGFGIVTSFANAESVGFIHNTHNYKKLLQYDFNTLTQCLQDGRDVIIPYPSDADLKSKARKYFKNGNQVIHHNLGTGNSNLSFSFLYLIEKHIQDLRNTARDVQRVDCVLYDDAYDNDNDNNQCGLLVFQLMWYSSEQMKYIHHKYKSKQARKKAPKLLFGDNDTDYYRGIKDKRKFNGGQAQVIAPYDRTFGYGIITTFYTTHRLPQISEYRNIIDKQFDVLQKHLLNGNDVVIPAPTKGDILADKHRYYKNGKQMIFHNIGTGIASLPFEFVEYIQFKIVELMKFTRGIQSISYYDYLPLHMSLVNEQVKMIYCCPFCCKQTHYLMPLKNCSHSLCTQCLQGYIVQHLDYMNNNEEHRFKCWAASNGKCQGRICLDDVYFAEDKCNCSQCTAAVLITDAGNGTILDDESLFEFKNIMDAFGKRSRWDTDECPQCKKPFPIKKEWRMKHYDDDGYYYGERQKFFDDVFINEYQCNCCGISINDDHEMNEKEEEEIGSRMYETDSNCHVCHQYYCDDCRSNCFYETEGFLRPPTPVAEAIYDFNAEIKLKQDSKSKNKQRYFNCTKFELCEICWYRFYCRQCPHCDYQFCGNCDAEWNGSTANWNEKEKHAIAHSMNDDNERKYDLSALIDEKNGKHDMKSHHSCDEEKQKIEQKKKKETHTREQRHKRKISGMRQRMNDAQSELKQLHRESKHKDKLVQELQKQKAKLEHKVLKLENGKLIQLNDQSEKEKWKIICQKRDIEVEKKIYKNKYEEFKKEMYVIVWQWKDNNNKWISYDDETSKRIEELTLNTSFEFTFSANNQKYEVMRTATDCGIQHNVNTKVKREIKRIEQKRGYIEYPKWWNMEGWDLKDTQINGTGADYTKPRLIVLDLTKAKAQEVMNAFYATSRDKYPNINVIIISIQSMQNQRLWDKYWNERCIMIRDIGENTLNEMDLWHGTKAEDVMDEIEYGGFRKEFNKTAMWGQGTYFATHAGYSVSYSSHKNGVYKMFQCKVLCGQSHIGGNYSLETWPKKRKRLIYDSLVSTAKDIYVIHDDVRAYPMFVITFKLK